MASIEKSRILIAENDPALMEFLPGLIGSTGYEVRLVQDAGSALDAVRTWKPTLVLIGDGLEDASGIEALEKIRTVASVPGLLLLSEVSEEAVITSLALGATDIIKKPFGGAELILKLGHVLEREKQRRELEEVNEKLLRERSILARYFSDDIVLKIMGSGSATLLGESLMATVLFVDIRNFTGITEKLNPSLVAETLCFLYTDLMDLIFSHQGSVNKLIGDAILATFGCPFNSPSDAENAVRCALDIRQTLTLFNQARPAYLTDEIKIGMGITTGNVFAGNIGSFRRMEYTVIGDVVNTASRLQTLTKRAGVDLLMDATTQARVHDRFVHERLFKVVLRGKKEPTDVYTVHGVAATDDGLTFF